MGQQTLVRRAEFRPDGRHGDTGDGDYVVVPSHTFAIYGSSLRKWSPLTERTDYERCGVDAKGHVIQWCFFRSV